MHDNRHSFSPTGDIKFTIVDGQVTGLERVIGNYAVPLPLPSDASFTVADGTVTETLTRGATTATLTYTADASDNTLYHLSQEVKTFDTTASGDHLYTFTLVDGAVTALSETFGTSADTHTIDVSKLPGASFSVSGNTITETTVHGNALETLLFTSTDGASYKLVSETATHISVGAASTALDVDAHDRLSFTFSGESVTAAQAVKADGTSVALATHGNASVAYTQPAAGYVVETVTRGAHASYEVYHDGNGDGIYTEVAHGSGTTVDIVGLQTQITAAVDGLL